MSKIIISKQFRLQARDFIRGALLAIVVPLLEFLLEGINNEALSINWKKSGTIALSAFISYLIKNYFTGPRVVMPVSSNKHAENLKEDLTENI